MPSQPTRRTRKLVLEPEGAPIVPRGRALKLRSAIHLAERFSQRCPATFVILTLQADLLEKRTQVE
jgi:hypothetical protein